MSIVDEHCKVSPRSRDHLNPSLDALNAAQGLCRLLQGESQRLGKAQDRQCIIRCKEAGNAHPDWQRLLSCQEVERNLIRTQTQILGHQISLPRLLRGQNGAAGSPLQHPRAVRVICVQYTYIAPAKEYGLGPGVVLHGAMEVQMILCQIGKGGSLEVDTPHPVQGQGMGGDLHHHIPAPCRSHPGQQALEGKALRCGALCGERLLADHVLNGANKAHPGPGDLLQHRFQQKRHRSFAIGAGDAHHGHAFSRVTVPICAHLRQSPAGGGHLNIGRRLCGNSLRHHQPGPPSHGLVNIPVAIGGKAGNRHKDVSRLNLPGIIGHASDVPGGRGSGGQNLHPLQQFRQLQSCRLLFI
ncbi:unknown [Firmicutes bacterium CAG:137]|nr:unknown [Firmicutes bacterium CAG:137]